MITAALEVAAKATTLVLIALAAVRVRSRLSAAQRHWVLTMALCGAAAMPLLSVVAPAWAPFETGAESGDAGPRPPALEVSAARPVESDPIAGRRDDRASTVPAVVPVLFAVWAGGVLIGLGVMAVGFLRLARLAAAAQAAGDVWWSGAEAWSRASASERSLRLLQSDHPALLATWGITRPAIILPKGAGNWTPARIRIVLAHELAHVGRGDWAVQIIAEFVRALYWFNPVMWRMCRAIRRESEHACDDIVLSGGVNAAEYAEELLNIARDLNGGRKLWMPAPAMARSSNLVGRVMAMLNSTVNRSPLTRKSRAVMASTALVLALALAGFDISAQTFSTLAGSVADQMGGALPNARLVLVRRGDGAKYEIRSDQNGRFSFVGLLAGEYELHVESPGFRRRVSLATVGGGTTQSDVVLEVGSLEETINIMHRPGEAPAPPPARSAPRAGFGASGQCVPSAVGGNLKQPQKIVDARPRYPAHLGDARQEAAVVLDTVIGTDGFVRDARAVDPRVDPDFLAAAVEAVQQWQFTPVLLNCTAIPVHMKVTANFRVQ